MDCRDIDREITRSTMAEHPHPLLFVTVSGAHLYGFASADSDYDLRGCHVAPLESIIGLTPARETVEIMGTRSDVEMDLVTHDAAKFLKMLLGRNGYVLEQIHSTIVLKGGPAFERLKELSRRSVTRHHRHHFRSFSNSQWEKVSGAAGPTVKGMLYTYRPLMAGIHLMRTRDVESNIVTLNEFFELSAVADLVERKINGAEKQPITDADMAFHRSEFDRLGALLEAEAERSGLPETPEAASEVDAYLIDLRMGRIPIDE